MYCPHRWGLIKIDDVWAENFFVIKANLEHKNVHSDNITYKKNMKILNAISVFNDDLNLYGVTDVVELVKNKNGVLIDGEKYELTIVEHKPTKPKTSEFNFDDALQVFAQKLCVDYIFKTNSTAVIYYRDVKKRISLPFDSEYDVYFDKLCIILEEMQEYISQNKIPEIKKGQKCNGCSLKDLCIPKLKKPKNVRDNIFSQIEGAICENY